MKLTFLGGVSKVGPLSMVMEYKNTTLIFDHGMLPADPPEYPMRPPLADLAFLSHSHLDHCGMIPSLVRMCDVSVLATHPTLEVVELLLYDSLKIAEIEGYPKYFDKSDVKRTKAAFDLMGFNSKRDIGGMEIEVHSAGHIPGSMMVEIKGEETALFTGDIHTESSRLVWGAHPVKCDTLILESTYSGREHEDRSEIENEFLDDIDDVLAKGGQAIVPAFAVGRTQEILMVLDDRGYDVWFDGMGRTVNNIYLSHTGFLRSGKALEKAVNNANPVRSRKSRRDAKDAEVVVTTSGMVEGGPVMEYIMNRRRDPNSAIFLTGYQVEGTNGDRLLNKGMVHDRGATVPVECTVKKYDFSAHAGHTQLVEFAHGCDPQRIVLMHGDNREELAQDLDEYDIYMPIEGEVIEV